MVALENARRDVCIDASLVVFSTCALPVVERRAAVVFSNPITLTLRKITEGGVLCYYTCDITGDHIKQDPQYTQTPIYLPIFY